MIDIVFESYATLFGLMTWEHLIAFQENYQCWMMRFNTVIYQKFRNCKFSELAELKISETKLKYATFLLTKQVKKWTFFTL